MNSVNIIGNLAKKPELRMTQTEKAVTTFDIAVNDGWGDKKTTHWLTVTAWGKLAENVAAYTDKGSKVAVSGRLTTRSWEAKDGSKRKTVEIVASDIEFLNKVSTGNHQPPADEYGDGDIPF